MQFFLDFILSHISAAISAGSLTKITQQNYSMLHFPFKKWIKEKREKIKNNAIGSI